MCFVGCGLTFCSSTLRTLVDRATPVPGVKRKRERGVRGVKKAQNEASAKDKTRPDQSVAEEKIKSEQHWDFPSGPPP